MIATLQSQVGTLIKAYIADPETGLLHRFRSGCADTNGVFYLNWHAAVMAGYRLCDCCQDQAGK